MAKYSCPSCGAPFNGKKCRACGYEHFGEEIRHGLHTHRGEPLVIDSPARRPIPRKDPLGCEVQTRKIHPLMGFLVLALIICVLIPVLQSLRLTLERNRQEAARQEAARLEAARDALVAPEDRITLYQDDTLYVFASKQDSQNISDGFTLCVQNNTPHIRMVQADLILVNGYVMPSSILNTKLTGNTTGQSDLDLWWEDMENAGIGSIESLAFRLVGYDEDYNVLFTTDLFSFGTPPETIPDPGGQLLYQEGGLQVRYLRYIPNSLTPEVFELAEFLFYLENTTSHTLHVHGDEVQVNGNSAHFNLWTELPPGTRAVIPGTIFLIEGPEIQSPAYAWVELTMEVYQDTADAAGTIIGPFRFAAEAKPEPEETVAP